MSPRVRSRLLRKRSVSASGRLRMNRAVGSSAEHVRGFRGQMSQPVAAAIDWPSRIARTTSVRLSVMCTSRTK